EPLKIVAADSHTGGAVGEHALDAETVSRAYIVAKFSRKKFQPLSTVKNSFARRGIYMLQSI
ncbi:hypothetical protein ACOSHH_005420, partial [Klebsiella aerogenes]